MSLINHKQTKDGITIIAVKIKKVPQSPLSQSTKAPEEDARVGDQVEEYLNDARNRERSTEVYREAAAPVNPLLDYGGAREDRQNNRA